MPVYSMTGYANGQTSGPGGHADTDTRGAAAARLGVEIRSVNSRFLDLAFKLPEELRQHEPALRELLMQRLKRGKVELRVSLESTSASTLRAPSMTATSGSRGVVSSLAMCRRPSESSTMSVKVPPMSTARRRRPALTRCRPRTRSWLARS